VQFVSNGLPAGLIHRSTPGTYQVAIGYGTQYYAADFGFNGIKGPVTPVELVAFTAERVANGVRVMWETAVEWRNLGYNLYRSEMREGGREQLNPNLIAGLGTSAGQSYEYFDATADRESTYYYWLEDMSWEGETEIHGPAIVVGAGGELPSAEVKLASFRLTNTWNLCRIRAETLTASGINLATVEPGALQVWINGRQTAIFVTALEAPMQSGDYLLFYAPATEAGSLCELRTGAESRRMAEVYAAPVDEEGAVWTGSTGVDGRAVVWTTLDYVRYLLIGLPLGQVYLLDVTDPEQPQILYGFAWLRREGEMGVYFSHATEDAAKCVVVPDDAVIEVEHLTR
jgi:hypothetical protein